MHYCRLVMPALPSDHLIHRFVITSISQMIFIQQYLKIIIRLPVSKMLTALQSIGILASERI